MNPPLPIPQGFGPDTTERLPLPDPAQMDDAQRAATAALVAGPRGGVFGPFVPLMRTPVLLDRVAALGEVLRFRGQLPARLREWTICIVARRLGNQFEWAVHAPLARAAGVDAAAVEALRLGARPTALADDEALALDLCDELLRQHGLADPSWQRAVDTLGEAGVIELTTLIGYFAMICWVMNIARTPGPASAEPPLPGLPG